MGDFSSGLMERLGAGETIVCAEGYVFNFERRGYLKAGPYVPEVILEHPQLVRELYEEFVHAGSDVVLAFTVGIQRYSDYTTNKRKLNVTFQTCPKL